MHGSPKSARPSAGPWSWSLSPPFAGNRAGHPTSLCAGRSGRRARQQRLLQWPRLQLAVAAAGAGQRSLTQLARHHYQEGGLSQVANRAGEQVTTLRQQALMLARSQPVIPL